MCVAFEMLCKSVFTNLGRYSHSFMSKENTFLNTLHNQILLKSLTGARTHTHVNARI